MPTFTPELLPTSSSTSQTAGRKKKLGHRRNASEPIPLSPELAKAMIQELLSVELLGALGASDVDQFVWLNGALGLASQYQKQFVRSAFSEFYD